MGELSYLTAKEARNIAETSNAMKNHLYKQIKEEAKDCRTSTIWGVEGCSEDIVTKLVKDLKLNGYTVKRDEDDYPDDLIIEW